MRQERSAYSRIGLWRDQIERMKKNRAPLSAQIYAAVRRFERGEILPQNAVPEEKRGCVVSLHLRKRPDYPDAMIRNIIDAHFRTPVDHGKEIEKLEDEISAMFPRGEYILEEVKS